MNQVSLSEAQQAIVDSATGSLVVVASPGSGKTTILAHRVKRYLETRRGFGRVLAVTFTTVAASNLRRKITDLCGTELAGFVDAMTFHGFAARLLNQHGSHIGLVPGFLLSNELEDRVAIATEAFESINGYSPSASDAATIANEISRFNERYSLDDKTVDSGGETGEIEQLANRYRELSLQYNQIDFSLLIALAIELLTRFPLIVDVLRATYRVISVDEFQDTNDAQFHLLYLVAGAEGSDLVLLADQDQVIYQWNGASPERLGEAVRVFNARVAVLPTSYRCPPKVVEIADRLIRHNGDRFIDIPLNSDQAEGGDVVLKSFADEADEVAAVVDYAAGLTTTAPGESIAVLCRARKMVDGILAIAKGRGLDGAVRMGRSEFVAAPIILTKSILRSAARSDDRSAFRLVIASLELLTGRTWDRNLILQKAAEEDRQPLFALFEFARNRATSKEFSALTAYVTESLISKAEYRDLSSLVFSWCDHLLDSNPDRLWASDYLDERPMFESLERRIKGLRSEGVSLAEYVAGLETESRTTKGSGGLSILTVHGAKGLEFDTVIIPGLSEGGFPSYFAVKAGSDSAGLREERRSLYVAITRSRKRLMLSYAKRYKGWQAAPSRFLSEMLLI